MSLRHIRICGGDFDLRVYRNAKQQVRVQLIKEGMIVKEAGPTASFRLENRD